MNGIHIYGKDTKNPDKYVELKTETMKATCELRHLSQEVLKKQLEYFVNEMKRISVHLPRFAHTESASDILNEVRQTISTIFV